MKHLLVIDILCYLFILITPVFALWPLPQVYEHSDSTLWLSDNVRYVYKHFDPPRRGQRWLWNRVHQFTLLVRRKSSTSPEFN